jgi:hypothetical protein
MDFGVRTRILLLIGRRVPPPVERPPGDNAAMAYIETDLELHELCQRASKEHDHEKLMDLIKQINDLLDQKHRESGTEDDEKREVAPALTIFFGSHRDRWLREWLEYQPLFIALAS